MSDKKRKKREAPISYRPPAGQREEFFARAQNSGMSVCAFITKSCLGVDPPRRSRRPSVEEKHLARLLAEAAAIRAMLDEITRAGDAGNTLLYEDDVQALHDLRAALLRIAGRQP